MKKIWMLMISTVFCCMGCGILTRTEQMDAATADSQPDVSPFEKAVEIIKKYETMHQPRHWPFVGYGHKVLPGEKFNRKKALSEDAADALLRKDLLKNCAQFREFGADSLLLGVLAYNIGSGATMRSSVVKKLREGDRDIIDNYIAHCRYRGKVHSQIRRRRIEEFENLFADNLKQEEKVATEGFSLLPQGLLTTAFADITKETGIKKSTIKIPHSR